MLLASLFHACTFDGGDYRCYWVRNRFLLPWWKDKTTDARGFPLPLLKQETTKYGRILVPSLQDEATDGIGYGIAFLFRVCMT